MDYQMMKKEVFNQGFAVLLKAFLYSGQKIDPETQEIYWRVFNQLPEPAFMNAVTICLEECEFFPTIAKLKEAANRKSFHTGALKQMQIEPPMGREEGIKVLKDLTEKLPDPKGKPRGVSNGKFAFMNRPYTNVDACCIGCGQFFRLPFAEGNEKAVICEECNK